MDSDQLRHVLIGMSCMCTLTLTRAYLLIRIDGVSVDDAERSVNLITLDDLNRNIALSIRC